jgi:hypothetical protein
MAHLAINEKHYVHTILYSKDWTAHDFYGKYHINRMKNEAPIPGTQVMIEKKHKEEKEKDIKRFEKETEERIIANKRRLLIKDKTSEVIYSLKYYYSIT